MMPAPSTAAWLISLARLPRPGARRLLHDLVGHEQPDQRVGLRRHGRLGEVLRLDRERVVAALGRRFLHVPECQHRRRVVRAGLAADHRHRTRERHRLLERVQLERRELLGALRLPVELAGDRLPDERERGVTELLGRHHGVHHAVLERRVGLLVGARRDPLDGVVHADEARHAHGTAEAREDPELHFGEADRRRGGGHPVVAGQRELEPAAEADAVDRGDRRDRQVLEAAQHAIDFEHALGDGFLAGGEHAGELRDVRAHDEHGLAGRDDHALDRRVPRDGLGGRVEVPQGGGIQLVD